MLPRFAVLITFAAIPAFCGDWNPRLAADYLDARQKEWFAWPTAKAAGGPCVSCHTGVTYLLVRPALRKRLGESGPTSFEQGLRAGLRARLEKKTAGELGSGAKEPFASQKMGVEAILSALFLMGPPTVRELSTGYGRCKSRRGRRRAGGSGLTSIWIRGKCRSPDSTDRRWRRWLWGFAGGLSAAAGGPETCRGSDGVSATGIGKPTSAQSADAVVGIIQASSGTAALNAAAADRGRSEETAGGWRWSVRIAGGVGGTSEGAWLDRE